MHKFKVRHDIVVILISFFVLFLLFYSIMLKSLSNLPNSNWSKEIPIQSFSFPSGTYTASQYDIYDCMPYNEGLLLSFVDEKGIHIKHLNLHFEVIQESFMPYDVNDQLRRMDLTSDLNGRYQLILYAIDHKKINIYELAFPSLELIAMAPEIMAVEVYTCIENSIFYVKDHAIYGFVNDNSFMIASVDDVSGITGFKSKDGYTLVSVEMNGSKRSLVSYTFDDNQENVQKRLLSPLVSDTSVSYQSLSAFQTNETLYTLTVLRNSKTNYNLANLQSFDVNGYVALSNDILAFSSYIPDPYLFFENHALHVGFIDSFQLGRIDVSRKYSSYPNYAISKIENGKTLDVSFLTKTENTKINPIYTTLDNDHFLVWMEYSDSHYTIYGSSNEVSTIQKSQHLSFTDIFGVFMNSITTYFPAFYASLVLIFGVMLPVIVLYGMLSFFKITWVERHGDILLRYMIIIHILLKFYFFIPTIKMTLVHMDGLNFFYSTFIGQIIFTLGLTIISLISFRLYYKTHKHTGSFVHYLRFSFVDCLLLIMAFYPLYFV
jgi:hypothetical protein